MRKLIILLALLAVSFSFATVADGNRAIDKGDYKEAIKQFEAAIQVRDTNVKAYYQLAHAKTLLAGTLEGKDAEVLYEEASEHARAAIKLDPDEPEGHFELARALGRLAQFRGVLQSLGLAGEVKKELDKTIELDPKHGGAYHALALWNEEVPWIAGGRSGRVEELFKKAIEVEPDSITHMADFAEILIKRGNKDAAKAYLETALSLKADTYGRQEDHDFAQGLMDKLGK